MSRKRKPPERVTIVSSPNRRPYGAKLVLLLEKHTNFNISGECVFLITPEVILRVKPKKLIHEDENGWEIYVDGFATAGEAEQFGLKVALGFLWTAIQGRYSARLLYHTPLPCVVYDRTQSKGMTVSAFGEASISKGIKNVVEPLDEVVSSSNNVDPKLLVALEIFAASRLETTERAKFVGIVSAIEPIAIQQRYQDESLLSLIKEFKRQLNESDVDQGIRNSLVGRIDQLKYESVSRAIKRLVENSFPGDPQAVEIVEEAYGLRSKILHEGSTDADLQQKSQEVEEIIRRLFEIQISNYAHNI